MSSELQRKCWEAEENDKISREFLAVSDERLRRAVKQREALKKALIRLMKVGKLATEEDYELGRWALDLAEERE